MAICGSRDWTSVSSMMFRVPPAAVPAALEAPVEAAVDAAVELEPPQADRARAAAATALPLSMDLLVIFFIVSLLLFR